MHRYLYLFTLVPISAALGQFGDLSRLGQIGQSGKSVVKRIELGMGATRVRPFASTVVQVKVYGEFTGKDGKTQEGRLQQAGWTIAVPETDSGWLSKAFKFQGQDTETFVDGGSSVVSSILRNALGQFTLKDSVVYHAPEKPGKYRIEAKLGEVTGIAEIEVDAEAPSTVTAELFTFGAEPPIADPYRKLAEHYAPYVAQETWFDWRADALCRSDFDNDWDAGNNWESLGKGSTQAYVYYAAIESQTHWFLIYNFFHARDYSDNCVAGTCHENDNEGMVLGVRKDGSEFGKMETMETLAHNNVYSYVSDSAIRNGARNIEGNILVQDGSHPVVFLEAGGHGALGGADKKSFFAARERKWRQNTGITYVYKGVAERPRHGMDREVGYELLPIYHHWWARATRETAGSLMSAFYRYQPFGNRPAMRVRDVAGSFAGRFNGEDKAKPFWGWHDMATQRRKILATGQWATDPAYAVSRNLSFPATLPVSLEYVFNPYLYTPEVPFVEVVRNVQSGEVAVEAPYTGDGTAAPLAAVTVVPTSGSCELEVRVDGTVVVKMEGAEPRFEVMSGAPPEVLRTECSGAVPMTGDFRVEKKSGRGKARMLDAAAGRVEIEDSSKGAAAYKLVIRWLGAH